MAEIVLQGVTKRYTEHGAPAVDAVDFRVADGEFLVLVGPSGCGKSTLLRMIAGLESVSAGQIRIGDRDVTHVQPRDRDVAMVFQNYALYPHMTVRDNIGYPLKVRKVAKTDIQARVREVARMLGLGELLDRKPAELSGGQRQRVAMGRAITREPAAFLMDEPLSNLDAKLRVSMRAQLAELHHRLAATVVYVTHDQVEAMTLGQRVAVLNQGCLQQVDTPQRLYEEPLNLFVASFIGSPSMNLVSGTVQNGAVELAGFSIPLDPAHRPDANGQVIVGIRPQAFEAAELAPADRPTIEAVPRVVEELGAEALVIFSVDAPRVELGNVAAAEYEEESLLPDARASFTARVDPRARPRVDEPLRLAVDSEALYFFDPKDGRNLLLAEVPRPMVSAT